MRIHPTQGVNPHLTFCFCSRCGKDVNELILIGNHDDLRKCASCGSGLIGMRRNDPCGKCGDTGPHELIRKIDEGERLPASQLCDDCKKEMVEHAEIVRQGGVYWKCEECNRSGVIRPGEFSNSVRSAHARHHGVPTWDKPCGIGFRKCSEHTTDGGGS